MNGKTTLMIVGAGILLGAGAYAGYQLIDWNHELEKMTEEIEDKNFWQDEQKKMEEDLAQKNTGEEVDWNAESEKMAQELSDESALAKYNQVDWNKELDIMADDLKTKNYSGTWEQVATYINGEIQDHAKATLILTKDRYEFETACLAAGALKVVADAMTMTVETDSCTGGKVKGPFTYNYQISKDNQILVLDITQSGLSMREVFKRAK